MIDIEEVLEKIICFRKERDWEKFHKPKDLAISLVLEATEVLEHFQWKTDEQIEGYIKNHKDELADELADVFNYLLLMVYDLDIDLFESTLKKIEKNSKKYPIEKSKGVAIKYTDL